MTVEIILPKTVTINVNVSGLTDPEMAARFAALEKLVADGTDAIVEKVKAAADKVVDEVNKVGDRVAADVAELQRLVAASGLTAEQTAAFDSVIDGLTASAEKLAGIDPLPDFPPAGPTP